MATTLLTLSLLLLSMVLVPGPAHASSPAAVSGASPSPAMTPSHGSPPAPGAPSTFYTISFDESGLTAGTSWYVNLTLPNGSLVQQTSITPTVTFSEPNGDYTYLIESPVPVGTSIPLIGPIEEFVVTSGTIGVVKVNGASPSPIPVTYQEKFLLAMVASPTAGGIVFPGITYVATGANVTIIALSNPGYVFTSWTGVCIALPPTCAYSGTSSVAQIAMSGPVVETATFSVKTYPVTFEGIGLPATLPWTVTFNGTTTSNAGPIGFTSPNGTFNYSVASPVSFGGQARFLPGNLTGRLPVRGSAVTENVSFNEQFYLNASVASPGGGNVTPTNQWYDNGTTVTLIATPGPGYAFTGWSGTTGSGILANGNTLSATLTRGVTEIAHFAWLYPVAFQENGLPANTAWGVGVGGESFSGSAPVIPFSLVNGSYEFSLGLVPGYHPALETGSFVINGSASTINVTFDLVTYGVVFAGHGNGGSSWSVSIDGSRVASDVHDNVSFALPNGTYSWTLKWPTGYKPSVSSSGSLVVYGQNVTWQVPFRALGPNGLLGVGQTNSYAVIGALVGVALLVVVVWALALGVLNRPGSKPAAPPPSSDEPKSSDEEDPYARSTGEDVPPEKSEGSASEPGGESKWS